MLRLNFYKVNFQPNMLVVGHGTYLSNHVVENIIVNEQIITPKDYISNNRTLTLRLETNGGTLDEINYASICEDDLAVIRYYYISNKVQVSEFIYDITFELDVVNTYQSEIWQQNNYRNVKVLRQHKNRFTKYDDKYYRIYDRVDENLGDLTQDITSETDVTDSESYVMAKGFKDMDLSDYLQGSLSLRSQLYLNTSSKVTCKHYYGTMSVSTPANAYSNFYVMYANDASNLVNCTVNVTGVGMRKALAQCVILHVNPNDTWLYAGTYNATTHLFTAKTTFKFNSASGPTRTITGLEGNGSFTMLTAFQCTRIDNGLSDGDTINIYTNWFKSVIPSSRQSQISSTDYLVPSIKEVSRVDSNIKQVQSIPFTPDEVVLFMNEVLVTQTVSMSSNLVTLDDNSLDTLPIDTIVLRDKKYESKLFGSYVTKRQVVYDTFALPILPEYYTDHMTALNIEVYKPNDMSSDLAICCENLKCHNFNDNIVTCSRNNEIPVYTDDYLEYLRNGYNYDSKMQTLNKVKTAVGVATGLVGTGLNLGMQFNASSQLQGFGKSFVGSALGAGISTVGSLVNTAISESQNDLTLEQKRQSMLVASPTMSGSNSIELFKELNGGNVVKYVVSKPRDTVLNSIYNLFYFYGYADNQTYDKMPNQYTRRYFNYIQAEVGTCTIQDPVVRKYCTEAYANGIMFCRKYFNYYIFDNYFLYENWELNI